MEYKVVPFKASLDLTQKNPSQHVAEQLEEIIVKQNAEGWEYIRLESVSTWVAPDNGCFGIIGTKPGYSTSRQVIVFKKVQ